jgi:hypothetical protein
MRGVSTQDSVKTPSKLVPERELMHAKGLRQIVNDPHPAGIDRSQRILGGFLWFGLTALLIYIST